MKKITYAQGNYLKVIYFLSSKNNEVRITDIAMHMGISKPSVNRAVTGLKKNGFVEHEYYGNIILTPSGKATAKELQNRHYIIKRFLSDSLGISETTAEEDACQIEHIISNETVKSLCKYIPDFEGETS